MKNPTKHIQLPELVIADELLASKAEMDPKALKELIHFVLDRPYPPGEEPPTWGLEALLSS